MGTFEGGSAELNSAISGKHIRVCCLSVVRAERVSYSSCFLPCHLPDLREDFGPDRYNLIRRNCNHFANALCWRLLQRTIPGHVNRLADFGVCCSCLLPKKLLEEAPVGPNAGGGSGSSGFQMLGGTGRAKKDGGASSTAAFTGSGVVLGSTEHTSSSRIPLLGSWNKSSNGGASGADSLTDRREKARKAALARLDAQNGGSGSE